MCYQFKKLISKSWVLLIVGIAVSCTPKRNDLELSKFLIDSIQSQTIPDTRVEVFSIKAAYWDHRILLKGKTTSSEALEILRNTLKIQQIELIDSIIILPDPALKEKTWGLITLSVANLRYTPAHSAEMATQALMGTPVKVLQEENGWYLIQTPDRYIAWTESAGIIQLTAAQMDLWKTSDRIIFLADNGLILSSPENDARPVSDIVTGGILRVADGTSNLGSFIAVELPDYRNGFIRRSDCADFQEWIKSVSPDPDALMKTAGNQIGRPYLWGGTSVKGFDCSGFTKSVFLTGGLILSRDASQQVLQGSEISRESVWRDMKAGDLLFFGRKPTAELSERVLHVGMYIGGSEFIHCSGMVRVNSLDSTQSNYKPYYRTNLLHIKRIIGSPSMPVSFLSHPWYN